MNAPKADAQSGVYKWLVLALSAFTFTFVVAIPQMSLPVLFDEISADLGLSLVQVGWIWGIGSVLGILVGLVGGPIGDRFGPRRTLAVACLLMGIAVFYQKTSKRGDHRDTDSSNTNLASGETARVFG